MLHSFLPTPFYTHGLIAVFRPSPSLKWTEEQVNTIRKTSKANFVEGLDVIRLAIREGYERRKAERLSHSKLKASGSSASSTPPPPDMEKSVGEDFNEREKQGVAAGGVVLKEGRTS